MPNIDLTTLKGILNVSSECAMMQPDNNACGAYALVAAIGAHTGGVFSETPLTYTGTSQTGEAITVKSTLPATASSTATPGAAPTTATTSTPMPPSATTPAAASTATPATYSALGQAVYAITGILNSMQPPIPELVQNNGYNSPAAMAQVAITLGMQVQINLLPPPSASLPNLLTTYPGEEARCNAVTAAIHTTVNLTPGPHAAPLPNETHLICVTSYAGPHWLAQDANGFYDPANGSLGNNKNNGWINPQNAGDLVTMDGYKFTGLWMVITKPSSGSSSTGQPAASSPTAQPAAQPAASSPTAQSSESGPAVQPSAPTPTAAQPAAPSPTGQPSASSSAAQPAASSSTGQP